MNKLKYFAAFIMPVLAYMGIFLQGNWAWSAVLFSFLIVPLAEIFFPIIRTNYSEEEKISRTELILFDLLLYLNIPIIYGLIFFLGLGIQQEQFTIFETIGLVLSIGTTFGACGINVAHELGHRNNKWEQFLSKALLIPNLNLHFFIEHNRGHHKNVATPEDPVSSRWKEPIYQFYLRSIIGQFTHAWSIIQQDRQRNNQSVLSLGNEMIQYQIIHLLYIISIFSIFGLYPTLSLIFISIVSFFVTETTNYITHYALLRTKLENGRYEVANNKHSWNSNHILGRIIFYELTRHSDHHFKTDKKYQILEYNDPSPELPYGYSTSMVIALIPPLWFHIMNPEVLKYQEKTS